MEPVRTARSNLVMLGPAPGIADAWSECTDKRTTYLVWRLSDEDRAAIAAGANLRMGIWQVPMPPVSLATTDEQALTPDGARWNERARRILRDLGSRSPLDVPPGYWAVSEDVWRALQESGALDRSGVPTLCHRPLMLFSDHPDDSLAFVRTDA